MTRYVIVGGGLAAAAAAKGIRSVDQDGSVTILSQEKDPPYNRPDLTKSYLRGETERTASYVEPESWYADNQVVLRLGAKVSGVDRAAHSVQFDGADAVSYDKLLLVTGARIRPLRVPGTDLKNVFYLRAFPQADAIKQAMAPGKRAVVVGGSFIGTESAASLAMKGLQVDLLNMDANLYGKILGREVGNHVEQILGRQGVSVHNENNVLAFNGENGVVTEVVTASGRRFPADLVIIGAGVIPNTDIAEAAGLTVDNGIVVDEFLQTSDPDVYAAGDVARWTSPVFPRGVRVEHWDVANNSGERAGKNMAGEHQAYDGMPFVFSDIGDTTMDVIGAASQWDAVVWRDLGGEQFGAAYLQDGRVVQGATIGNEDYLFQLGDLIRAGTDVSGKLHELADPAVEVSSLA